jgi:hypothetical protein
MRIHKTEHNILVLFKLLPYIFFHSNHKDVLKLEIVYLILGYNEAKTPVTTCVFELWSEFELGNPSQHKTM